MLLVAQKVSEQSGSNDTVICEATMFCEGGAMVICEEGYNDL